MTKQTAPDGSIITPSYNEAGLLNGETVVHSDPAITTTYIKDIDYNEKGQRNKIIYGNDVITTFDYDKETFRLKRLETKRQNNDPLQDWYYTFDPVGNITHIEDKNIPVIFFDNQKITGVSTYTYDALYRLAEATGRENDTPLAFDSKDNWNDVAFMKQLNPGDPMAMRNYTQSYLYDSVGNILQMRHQAAGNNWTRDYIYQAANNRLISTQIGSETYTYPHHAQHGFMTAMPHLEDMGWNFKEELIKTIRQRRTDGGTPETTYYQYDGQGQRIRKITENQADAGDTPTKKEERIYIAGYELYKKHSGADAGLERISLSLMDKQHRFIMIDTETKRGLIWGRTSPEQTVRYQLHNHIGSAALELDETAQVISYEEYHPFGTTAYQAKNRDIKSAAKRYRYTGMERDEESGLEYHSARYYLPWLGRWGSCDPAGFVDAPNLYLYTLSNPVHFYDRSGRQTMEERIERIESPVGWFFAKTGYDIWNVMSLGTLSKVEAQKNLGTWQGVGESTFTAARNISNTASFGLQERIYETQMKEGPGLASIGKGVLKAGEDILPIEEADVLANPEATAEEKWRAGGMALSKTANLFALGLSVTSKNVTVPREKGQGTHTQSLSLKEVQARWQKEALKGQLRKTKPPKNIKQRRIWEKKHGKLDPIFQADHVVEMQLGGAPKKVSNLAPLDKTPNISAGPKIQKQIETHRLGQRYDRVLIEGERVPVNDVVGVPLVNQAANIPQGRESDQTKLYIPDIDMDVTLYHPKSTIH